MSATERVVGRNITSITAGVDGLLFTKQIVGPLDDARRRFENCLRWDHQQRISGLAISPGLVDHEHDELMLIYPYLTDATSLQSFVDDHAAGDRDDGGTSRELDRMLAEAAALVAHIHAMDPGEVAMTPAGPSPGPRDGPLRKFTFLTPDEFAASSGAELECWRLFHHDEELHAALASWLDDLGDDDFVPVHGDLRPDQFLVAPEGMFIIDWEEFGLGPPTRDVAGLAGAVIFDALYRTFTAPTDEELDTMAAHRVTVTRGARLLESVAITVRRLVDAYEHESGRVLDRSRLAADIGWYLIERVLARAMLSQKLAAFDKAIAGIGREILLRPKLLATLTPSGGR